MSDKYKFQLDEQGNTRLYVLAHIDKEEQNKFINQAHEKGYLAEAIRSNCLELKLDDTKLTFDYNKENVDVSEYLAKKTRYANVVPRLSLTTMSPDDAGYYYNWCPLECMLDNNQIPLFRNIDQLV